MRPLARWPLEPTANLVLLSVAVVLDRNGFVVRRMPAQVSPKRLPLVPRIAERREEGRFEPTHRMAFGEELVADLVLTYDRVVNPREPHVLFLPCRPDMLLT